MNFPDQMFFLLAKYLLTGQRYALMKQKTVLATLFRKYRVESTQNEEEIQPTIDLVLRPGHGPFIKIQRRY